jgi:hypothetical protein
MSLIDTSRALAQFDELVLKKELFHSHSKPAVISEDGLEVCLTSYAPIASELTNDMSPVRHPHRSRILQ